jgi:hypothetical protein
MKVTMEDKNILRELGRRIAEIAALPIQEKRKKLWKDLNALKPVRPLVWIFEIPWHEMNVDNELTIRCKDPFLMGVEDYLRRTIYQWEHLQGDMVVEPYIASPVCFHDSGIGIAEDTDIIRTDSESSVVSRHFKIQIADEDDIEKIRMPVITPNPQETEARFTLLSEIEDGIIPVKKNGVRRTSVSPWDELVRFMGVDQLLLDLSMRPAYIHKVIGRMTQAHCVRLDQFEKLNLLSLNNDNTVLGGGYCYSDELPGKDYDPRHVRPHNMWGRTMSQIFSAVSPDMHEEFALNYELEYLKRFGLTYYGCCEPLHKKVGILKKIPNLRTISMSPWVDIDEAAAAVGQKYVFSLKPNPAFLASDRWEPEAVRKDLKTSLQKTRHCTREVILKDISTVRYEPCRLWEWAKIASEEAAVYD